LPAFKSAIPVFSVKINENEDQKEAKTEFTSPAYSDADKDTVKMKFSGLDAYQWLQVKQSGDVFTLVVSH
jgi:hypothetical protein